MNRTRCALILVLAGCATPTLAEIARLQPHQGVYELSMGPLTLGDAAFSLAAADAENCYRYQYTATPQGMAKMFVGQIREQTDFCVTASGVRSQHFEFHRADKPKKDYILDFDWKARLVRGGEPAEQKIPEGALDRLAIQQAVRLWVMAHAQDADAGTVEFTMADRKRVVTYRFAISGREKVKVPAGQFDAILVQRVDDPNKVMKFWLAPERNYIPVKVLQDNEDDPELRMVLK
jgi:hypothetical protein